jgi:hypothetical protein
MALPTKYARTSKLAALFSKMAVRAPNGGEGE